MARKITVRSASLVPLALVGVLVISLVAAAVVSLGFPLRQLDLNDTGIWVSNDSAGEFGRFNKAASGLDARLSPPGQRLSPFSLDIFQDGNAVFGLDNRNARLTRIDAAAGSPVAEQAVGVDPTSTVQLRGGTVAVMDRAGRVWAGRYDPLSGLADLGSLDPALKPLAELGLSADAPAGSAALAVSASGTIFAASADGRLITIQPSGSGFAAAAVTQGRAVLKTIAITTVAESVVAVDPLIGTLVLPGGKTVELGADPALRLQQPSGSSSMVLVATTKGLSRVALDTGQVFPIVTTGGGEPAAPVQLAGCDFGAWAGVGHVVQVCGNADPTHMQVAKGLVRPAFRINRGLIVLNDQADGLIYDLELQASIEWPMPNPDQTVQKQTKDEQQPSQSEPKAVDDDVWVRADRTTALHLLDNDTDTVAGVLSITAVSKPVPAAGVKVQIAPDGQTVLVFLPRGMDTVRFSYTISDGSVSDEGNVVVNDAGTRESSPTIRPNYLQPDYAVAAFGTLSIPIPGEWRDGEGDPVTLVAARDKDGNPVPVTPDGQIDFSAGEAAQDESRVITYQVTDGLSAPVSRTISVRVLGKDSFTEKSPIAQPDVVRGEAGKPIVITPLANDVPGADPRNLAARLTLSGDIADQANLTVTTDEKTGQVTALPRREGPYTLTYSVAFGSAAPAKGLIRIEALRGAAQEPVAMPDQAAMRGRTPVLIDVLANDYDPAGNLLSVVSAAPGDGGQVQAEVIQGRWLRVLPQVDLLAPNPQVVHYTISSGAQTATGDVLVTQLDLNTADRVLARKDSATVRAGDSVLIPVLTNDTTLSGQQVRLVTDGLGTDHDGQLAVSDAAKRGDTDQGDVGQAYIRGDQIRYVPPATVVGSRQVRIAYTATNADGDTAQSEAVVTIKPEPDQANPDRAPMASTVEARAVSGSRVQIPIPTSGQDPDGDSVVVTGLTSAPSLGRVMAIGPTSITYEAFPTDGLVGTDAFSYVVADKYGRTGIGTVRVSVTAPGQTQPPVAVDDRLTAAPGAELQLNVLGNDYYSRDDVVTIAGLTRLNNPIPAGAGLDGETGPISLTGPGDGDQPVSLNYALVGNGGTGPAATVTVVSKAGFNNPPTVVDQTAVVSGKTGTANLLDKAWDVDGDRDALVAEPLVEIPGATLNGSQYSVPLADHAQVIPFRVTDAAAGVSAAVVYVPSIGAGAPQLKANASIDLATDATARFGIEDYVESPRGKVVRIASSTATTAPGADLEVKVNDAGTFTLTSKNGYVGPASVTVQVMDSASLTDDGVLSATVSIPVQIGDRTPVLRCPREAQTILQGGEAKNLDITTLCHVWSPDPDALGSLSYTAQWSTPVAGVEASAGHRVPVQASGAAVGGSQGVLTIGIAGTSAKPAALPIAVVAAPAPQLRSVRLNDIKANTPVSVPISVTSPLLDPQVKIISVEKIDGGAAVVSNTDAALTITPDLNTSGTLTYRVVATDLAAAPERTDRHATGTITLAVYARPSPPTAPVPGAVVESHSATLTWQPGSANGAAIDGYSVKIDSGPHAGTETACRSMPCRITGLANGEAVTFRVKAHNRAGWSDWSPASRRVKPDTLPGAPSSVSTSDPKDGSLLVSWGPISNDGSKLVKIYVTFNGRTVGVDPGASSYRATGLNNNEMTTFTVTAKNELGLGPSVSAKGQSSGRPLGLVVDTPVPQDIVGTTTATDIGWSLGSANGPTPVTYSVKRSDGKSICTAVTARTCTDDSVTFDGKSYTYAVTATNATGGTEHTAVDSSPSWAAIGTPDVWGSWTAEATGANKTVQVSYTVPASRGAGSSVALMDGGSVLKSLGTQTGGVHTETIGTLANGHSYSLRMRVCNEANRCSLSSTKATTPFGPLSDPAVSASHSDATVSASASGSGNGATATLRLYVDGVLVDERSGSGSISVSGSRNVGYSHPTSVRAELTATGRGTKTATTSETTGAQPLNPTISISRGTAHKSYTDPPGICTSSSCAYVKVTLADFVGTQTCKIIEADNAPSGFGSSWVQGNGTVQTSSYFGSSWLVIRCGSVTSGRLAW